MSISRELVILDQLILLPELLARSPLLLPDTITFDVGGAQSGSGYLHRFVGAGMSDFRININRVDSDKMTGWRFGDLDVFDKLDTFFDGETKVFTMRKNGTPTSIRAAKGSLIDVKQTLLVFLNNILQEPGIAYQFDGGSISLLLRHLRLVIIVPFCSIVVLVALTLLVETLLKQSRPVIL